MPLVTPRRPEPISGRGRPAIASHRRTACLFSLLAHCSLSRSGSPIVHRSQGEPTRAMATDPAPARCRCLVSPPALLVVGVGGRNPLRSLRPADSLSTCRRHPMTSNGGAVDSTRSLAQLRVSRFAHPASVHSPRAPEPSSRSPTMADNTGLRCPEILKETRCS